MNNISIGLVAFMIFNYPGYEFSENFNGIVFVSPDGFSPDIEFQGNINKIEFETVYYPLLLSKTIDSINESDSWKITYGMKIIKAGPGPIKTILMNCSIKKQMKPGK